MLKKRFFSRLTMCGIFSFPFVALFTGSVVFHWCFALFSFAPFCFVCVQHSRCWLYVQRRYLPLLSIVFRSLVLLEGYLASFFFSGECECHHHACMTGAMQACLGAHLSLLRCNSECAARKETNETGKNEQVKGEGRESHRLLLVPHHTSCVENRGIEPILMFVCARKCTDADKRLFSSVSHRFSCLSC
jgi:hypothetical protein